MNRARIYLDGERARDVLCRWVNLPDPSGPDSAVAKMTNRLAARYPEFLKDAVGVELFGDEMRWVYGVREHLRAAWDAANQDRRDWFIHEVRRLYALKVSQRTGEQVQAAMPALRKTLGLPLDQTPFEAELGKTTADLVTRLHESGMLPVGYPSETAFDLLMRYLQHHSREALHCKNPGCLTPYFFKDEGKRTQTYCSDDCGHEARLASKSRWWNEVGKDERAKKQKRERGFQ